MRNKIGPPVTWIDMALLVLLLFACAGMIAWLLVLLDARQTEIRDLRADLEMRAVLDVPPGVSFTQADTLLCYPKWRAD